MANTTDSTYMKRGLGQPVEWHAWSEDAFFRAQELGRPVLLGIGAAWCHWCHMLDTESYDDPQTAGFINENFVPVRVDRDERPDIDRRCQTAVMALTGSGGWPLTVFMTPEGKVFFGGTYFPPEARGGLPSFMTVLRKVADYHAQNRPRVQSASRRIFDELTGFAAAEPSPGEPSQGLVDGVIDTLSDSFDTVHGGFGEGPRFPHFPAMELLLARYFETRYPALLEMVEATLRGMARGGIHDHAGGGFHRYSVDEGWITPHFEKLCAINAGHLALYVMGYRATGLGHYRCVADGIVRFVTDELLDEASGGFFSSQDSDAAPGDPGDPGDGPAYFTWTTEELEAALYGDGPLLEAFSEHYELRSVSGDEGGGRGVIIQRGEEGEPDEGAARAAMGAIRDARAHRAAPVIDRTIYTGSNALLASSLLLYGMVLDSHEALRMALEALALVYERCFTGDTGARHFLRDGEPGGGFLLEDQAYLGNALLDAFGATGDPALLERAERVCRALIGSFHDEGSGGFFDIPPVVSSSSPALLQGRLKPIQDDPNPSGNAAAAVLMERMGRLTGDESYHRIAGGTLTCFGGSAVSYGILAAGYHLAVHGRITPPLSVIVAGSRADPRTHDLLVAAWSSPRPHLTIIPLDPDSRTPARLGWAREMLDGPAAAPTPFAVLCTRSACSEPVTEPEVLRGTLATFARERV